jgi:hypothetical protein
MPGIVQEQELVKKACTKQELVLVLCTLSILYHSTYKRVVQYIPTSKKKKNGICRTTVKGANETAILDERGKKKKEG